MPQRPIEIAVVGAGPAGSVVARLLAAGGARVVLFDHSHPREKTCAGGISARARAQFPELDRLAALGRHGGSLRLVSPAGVTVTVAGDGRTFAIDRTLLDQALLADAVAAGAQWRKEKVTAIAARATGYTLRVGDRDLAARLVIGADGVFSLVRRHFLGPIAAKHRAFGAHVLIKQPDPPPALLKFFGDRRGYAWRFNRQAQSSLGIGVPQTKTDGWRDLLLSLVAAEAPGQALPPVRGWSLPQAATRDFFFAPVAGADWLLLGDAAGHVDPLTGEGIYYAVWDAHLAAAAILADRPAAYDHHWREAYLPRFEKHLRLAGGLERKWLLNAVLAAGHLPLVGSRLFSLIGGK